MTLDSSGDINSLKSADETTYPPPEPRFPRRLLQGWSKAPQQGSELPPIDTGRQAWTFVLAAFVLDVFVWGSSFSTGVFLEWYLKTPPFDTASPTALSSVGTIALALNYAEMLLGIVLCRRFPHLVRRGMWVCLAAYVLAFVVASFAQEVGVLLVFQGILAGSAGGLMYAPIYLYLSEWFSARRALAGGTIFAGAGFGGFVFPLILNALLPRVGFRWTLRIYAAVSLVVCGLAIPAIKPRLPIRAPSQLDEEAKEKVKKESKIELRVLWDATFISVAFTVFVQGLAYSSLSTYLSTYTASFASAFNSSLVLAILNLFAVPGQIVTGALCDRYNFTYIMFGSAIILIVSIFALLRVSDTFAKVAGFAVILGMTGGGYSSCWFPSSVAITREAHLDGQSALVFGYLAITRGVASLSAGPIASILYQQTTTRGSSGLGYYGLAHFNAFVGGMSIAAAVGAVATEGIRRLRRGGVGKGEDRGS